LIELMVVIIILGMMVSLTALNWQRVVPRTQLNNSVRTISNVLHSTRSESITRNNEYRVIYDLDEHRYWVETPFKKGGGLAMARIPGEEDPEDVESRLITNLSKLGDGITFSGVTIDGETYSDGQCYVRFDPLGSSSAHTINLYQAKGDRYYTIEVLALTGLIRFYEGTFEREELTDGDFD
jgi:Tfp pilus assembly protein FimT